MCKLILANNSLLSGIYGKIWESWFFLSAEQMGQRPGITVSLYTEFLILIIKIHLSLWPIYDKDYNYGLLKRVV